MSNGPVRQDHRGGWFCDAPERVRRERLVGRHVEFGKAPAWIDAVDGPNAAFIDATRSRADALLRTG